VWGGVGGGGGWCGGVWGGGVPSLSKAKERVQSQRESPIRPPRQSQRPSICRAAHLQPVAALDRDDVITDARVRLHRLCHKVLEVLEELRVGVGKHVQHQHLPPAAAAAAPQAAAAAAD